MKQRILLAGIKAICLLLLSGCAFHQEYIVNVPTQAKGKDVNYSRIDYPDFSLHIRPLNDIKTFDMVAFVILPVYLQFKDVQELGYIRKRPPYDPNKEFRVLLAILPKDQGYSLDANKIFLLVDDITFPITGIEGPIQYFPYKNFAFAKDWDDDLLKLKAKKGYIFSVGQKEGERRNVTVECSEIALSQTDLWNCYELIFDCPTPSPKQNIKLDIGGLKKKDAVIEMPVVEFKESSFTDIGSIP